MQVNCGLSHPVRLLHFPSLRLRKGQFDDYEVRKMEQKIASQSKFSKLSDERG